jgi:hypothetical protein
MSITPEKKKNGQRIAFKAAFIRSILVTAPVKKGSMPAFSFKGKNQ